MGLDGGQSILHPPNPANLGQILMGPHILMQLFQGYRLAQLRSLIHSHQEFSLPLHSILPEEIENTILVKVIFPRNSRDQQSQLDLLGQVRIESKGRKVKVRQKPTGKQMVAPQRRNLVVHLLLQEQHSEFGVNVLILHQDFFSWSILLFSH